MKSELRLDRSTATRIKRLDNGYVKLPITATRVGILVYRDTEGKEWREFRPASEVFHADSMQSLSGVPVTNDHPSELLTAENTKEHQVGFTSNEVIRKDVFLETHGTITDKKAIEDLFSGKVQASAGYRCDVEETPGIWQGQRYDAIQRNIRYNHVAIVRAGRAGPDVRMHLDDANHTEKVLRLDSLIEEIDNDNNGGLMKVIVLDGMEYQVSPEAHSAITAKIRKDAEEKSELKAKLDAESSEKTKQLARADSLTDEVTNLKKSEPKMDEAMITARVQKRVALERFASSRLDSKTDLTTLTDREIIVNLIKLDNAAFKDEDKDDVYLTARFDHMVDTAAKAPAKTGSAYNSSREIAENRFTADSKDQPLSYEQARFKSQQQAASKYTQRIGYGVK